MDSDPFTVFCANISPRVTEELLYELFLQAGPLKTVKIPKNPQGEAKSFAFVEFQHECSVAYAIRLFHGTSLFGKELLLKPRTNNSSRPPPVPIQELRRTTSLPVIQHLPFPSPLQFSRPPLVPGFVFPFPILNPMFIPPPPSANQHIRFDEHGLPQMRSGLVPIPPVENSTRNQRHISSSYEETQPRRRDSYHHSREERDSRGSEKRTRYSDSHGRESYERRSNSMYEKDRKRPRESDRSRDSRDERSYREDSHRGSGNSYETESYHRKSYEGSRHSRSRTSDRR